MEAVVCTFWGGGDSFTVFNVFHSTQMGKNGLSKKNLVLCWEKAACKMEMSKSLFCEYVCFDASPNLSLSLTLELNVKQKEKARRSSCLNMLEKPCILSLCMSPKLQHITNT